MRRAQRSIPQVKILIAQDKRFGEVRRFSVFTGNGGSLMIMGEVASKTDLDDLKARVVTAFPNINFSWGVRVRTTSQGDSE